MDLLTALALISAEKSVRKQERREQRRANLENRYLSASYNNTNLRATRGKQ